MKLVVIWNNGDKQKIEISDQHAKDFFDSPPYIGKGFEHWSYQWSDSSKSVCGAFNFKYAREVYLEK